MMASGSHNPFGRSICLLLSAWQSRWCCREAAGKKCLQGLSSGLGMLCVQGVLLQIFTKPLSDRPTVFH